MSAPDHRPASNNPPLDPPTLQRDDHQLAGVGAPIAWPLAPPQVGTARPDAAPYEAFRPELDVPDSAQLESAQLESAQLSSAQLSSAQLDSAQSESAQSEPDQSQPVQSESVQSESAQSESGQPESAQSESGQSESGQPEVTGPDPVERERPVIARRGHEIYPGQLVLADGSVFEGDLIGFYPPNGVATGEVVFNTAMSGYQEVITDPSYAGQIIAFTYPHIGNYGVNAIDAESRGAFCRGIVVRDLARRASNHRATEHLESLLQRLSIPGIAGLDTRRLTKVLRQNGSMAGAFGDVGEAELSAAAQAEPGTDGVDLVAKVTTRHPYMIEAAGGPSNRLIVAYDFGIKTMILRDLARLGRVQVVPASTPAADVLALSPDGVFLSNGPGDPRNVAGAIEQIDALIGEVPMFGICLGHQLIALASGADVVKMPFGHHGANHPVQHVATKEVEITSQNHNFAVDAASFEQAKYDVSLTHINLNDGVCEGLSIADRACFSVQHHPEAGPGPHDSNYLFGQFATLMDSHRGASATTSNGGN